MNKKATFGVIFTLSLAFGGLNFYTNTAHAVDEGSLSGETNNQAIEPYDEYNATNENHDVMPISETSGNAISENVTVDCAAGYVYSITGTCVTPEEAENILVNGTTDEPLVVCADESEPGCEGQDTDPEIVNEDGEEEELEPELWPLILSLSALGATVVFVIIINLFGRKKS